MTRFKEKRRIDAAIGNRDVPELKWAQAYCRMRINLASRKDHLKTWQQQLSEVESAMKPQD
jgi:hypothetical protein